jgi:hypothetical protein
MDFQNPRVVMETFEQDHCFDAGVLNIVDTRKLDPISTRSCFASAGVVIFGIIIITRRILPIHVVGFKRIVNPFLAITTHASISTSTFRITIRNCYITLFALPLVQTRLDRKPKKGGKD